jgi:hypothetical protein
MIMNSRPINSITNDVMYRLKHVSQLYYRLILIVGTVGSGKTTVLRDISKQTNSPIINVSLELSSRMLELTYTQRSLKLRQLLDDIVNNSTSEIVILDNLEILFDVSLKQDPLIIIQSLSRNKTVIASWNGTIQDKTLFYAESGHPEYRKYQIQGFIAIDMLNQD